MASIHTLTTPIKILQFLQVSCFAYLLLPVLNSLTV
uniref:Uncharacterized protein n=1 Tax=Arundo donax TaxID=35708 RepID=A0A0A8ZMZ9_ARUDO